MVRLRSKLQRAFVDKLAKENLAADKPRRASEVYAEVSNASPRSAIETTSRLLSNPILREAYREAIAKHNPPDAISRDLKRLRRAKRGVWYEGQRVGEEDDHAAQTTALQVTLRAVAGTDSGGNTDARSINFNANIDAAQLAVIAKTLSELSSSLKLSDADGRDDLQAAV